MLILSSDWSMYTNNVVTTRTPEALTREECRPECEDGHQIDLQVMIMMIMIDLQGNCLPCPLGQYRQKGVDLGCQVIMKTFFC